MKKIFKLSDKEYEVFIRMLRREILDPQEMAVLQNLSQRLGYILFQGQKLFLDESTAKYGRTAYFADRDVTELTVTFRSLRPYSDAKSAESK